MDPVTGAPEFRLALPFHDHEPRGSTVPRLLVTLAGSRLRLIEKRERQALCEQLSNVGGERAMPIDRPGYLSHASHAGNSSR